MDISEAEKLIPQAMADDGVDDRVPYDAMSFIRWMYAQDYEIMHPGEIAEMMEKAQGAPWPEE